MNPDQFLKDIQGKNINFLIGSGASFGVVPTLWVESLGKSFEELLTSEDFNAEQKRYYILFGLNSGFVKQEYWNLIIATRLIENMNDLLII